MTGRQVVLAIALMAAVVLYPSGAPAQTATPVAADQTVARELFREGVDAARAGDWTHAREAFARSQALVPNAITVLNLAGAQARSNLLVEAIESYRAFVRASTPGQQPLAEEAARAIAELEPRVGRLGIHVGGVGPGDRVELDGRALPDAAVGIPFPANPGPHTLIVRRGETEVASRTVSLDEGEQARIELSVPAPPVEPAAEEPDQRLRPDGVDRGRPARTTASVFRSPVLWIAVGVVALGAAGAAVYFVTRDDGGELVRGNVDPGFWQL